MYVVSECELSSQRPAWLSLDCVRGDSFARMVAVDVEYPNPYVFGEVLREPVVVNTRLWEATITLRGEFVANITIDDSHVYTNELEMKMTPHETADLRPGVYDVTLKYSDPNTGDIRTIASGKFEVYAYGSRP